MYNDKHTIAETNQITDTLTNTKEGTRPKTPHKDLQNKNSENFTFLGTCWKCGEFGHSAKECQNNMITASQYQIHNCPTNSQTIELIRYPTPISPTRSPILTQQITAEIWNKLSSQMNEVAETNKLLKKAVKIPIRN